MVAAQKVATCQHSYAADFHRLQASRGVVQADAGKAAIFSQSGAKTALRGCGRRHAALAAEDELISTLFAIECWTDAANYFARKPVRRFCVSDEHYLPTLLAYYGEGFCPVFGISTACLPGLACASTPSSHRCHASASSFHEGALNSLLASENNAEGGLS